MNKDIALQLALKALKADMAWLETDAPTEIWEKNNEAITAIKEALETEKGLLDRKSYLLGLYDQKSRLELETKDEPVALVAEVHISRYTIEWTNGPLQEGTKLYTTPQRTWVKLTDEEIETIYAECNVWDKFEYERMLEAKLKEKNNG